MDFPDPGIEWSLLHCLHILYQLSYGLFYLFLIQLHICVLSLFSHVLLFAPLWTVACWAPRCMRITRRCPADSSPRLLDLGGNYGNLYCKKHHSFVIAQLVNNPPARRPQFDSWVGKILWRRDRLPTPVFLSFPCGLAGKESTCNAGDLASILGLGRSPGEGKGYLPTPVFWPREFHCTLSES